MSENNKSKGIQISLPKFDTFDIFSLTFWVALLVPSFSMPSSATYSFLRAVLFALWAVSFFVYLAIKVRQEKRVIFLSLSWGNYAVMIFAATTILSLFASAAMTDSLFGYDLSFISSAIILLLVVLTYFALKLAGLSLELAVSRIFSVLPVTLVGIDLLSVLAFIVPQSVLVKIIGNYAIYFEHLSSAPFALIGNASQTTLIHLVALIVSIYQLLSAFKKSKEYSTEVKLRGVLTIVIAAIFSFVLASGIAVNTGTVIAYLAVAAIIFVLANNSIGKEKKFITALSAGVMVVMILGMIVWSKTGILGKYSLPAIPFQETTTIISKAYSGENVPFWRQFTGFGTSTFPYLYMQYRSLAVAKTFGNASFFFKPAEVFTETYIEQGLLGLAALLITIGVAIRAYFTSTNKKALALESSILVATGLFAIITPSTLLLYVLFFVALAAFFDKIESQPEMLSSIRAFDVKESYYTNRTVSQGSNLLLAKSILVAVVVLVVLYKPVVGQFAYTRATQRYSAAAYEQNKKDENSSKTLINAYNAAASYSLACSNCNSLYALKLNTILTLHSYYDGLTEKERAESTELRQVKNMLLQSATDLLAKNPSRYDHWIALAQSYRIFATEEKSTSFYVLSIQSLKNALSLNPYSIDANYLYIDTLLAAGNSTDLNTEIKAKVATLKEIVGTPLQVRFYDGILAARNKEYANAIKLFEQIKGDIEKSTSLTAEQKTSMQKLVDSSIADIKKAEQQSTVTPTPTPSTTVKPTATPVVTATPTATATPSPTATSTPTVTPSVSQ